MDHPTAKKSSHLDYSALRLSLDVLCTAIFVFIILWSSGEFFKQRAKAVATQEASQSFNMFTRRNPPAK
jgi:hypothetical protein